MEAPDAALARRFRKARLRHWQQVNRPRTRRPGLSRLGELALLVATLLLAGSVRLFAASELALRYVSPACDGRTLLGQVRIIAAATAVPAPPPALPEMPIRGYVPLVEAFP